MKNIKFIIPLLLVSAFSLTSITSCNKGSNVDTDFDGLTDNIDPDPKNNKYQISLIEETEEGEKETGELTLTMDYRNLLEQSYNHNLGLLSSFLLNAVSSTKPKVHNNVYPKTPTEASKVCPILAQIGGQDIVRIKTADKYKAVDPYDVANLAMAHHTFINENQKYQIYFIIVQPYVDASGWISNFDLGGVDEEGNLTENYKYLEGENHPDWTNRIHHKGFDTTTNRLLEEIKTYQEAHLDKHAKQITLVTGHSRGGAIANLIGKYFVDNNKEVRAYCFNSPNVTLAEKEVVTKEEYTTRIYNLINNADLVSRIPTEGWEFKLYGENIKQDIDEDIYKSFMKKEEYIHNTEDGIGAVVNYLDVLLTKDEVTSRNNLYEFRKHNHDDIWTRETEDELKAFLETLPYYFRPNSYASKCFQTDKQIWHRTDLIEGDYYYTYFDIRPALIKALMEDVIVKKDYEYIAGYLELLGRIIGEVISIYEGLGEKDFTIEGVKSAHIQPIACVMAEQYQKNNN